MTTSTALQSSAIFLFPALSPGTTFHSFTALADAFWRPNGGAQDPDWATAIPSITGDIVLRGGIARLSVTNTEDCILRVKIFAVWSLARPWQTLYTTLNNTNGPYEWDPSAVPDFATRFGKIMYMKQAMIQPRECMEVVHRFKPQKIDQKRFLGDVDSPMGSTLWWMLSLTAMEANLISASVIVVNSWNLSFSGDTV